MKHFPSAPKAALLCAFSTLLLGGCQQTPEVKPIANIVVPLCVNDECAVIDQNGSLLVGPDNDYSGVYTVPFSNSFIFGDNNAWNLASRDGKQVIKAAITDELYDLPPGLFGFVRDGKVGVMDEQGKEVQPAIFDNVFVGGDDEFIVYEVNDLRGILTAKGEKVSDPVFDSMYVRGEMKGHWVLAEREGQSWGYNLQTKVLRKLDFDEIERAGDDHLVVKREGAQGVALADAAGNLVVPFGNYWMGYPGAGLVAFKATYDGKCGYLDYQGKTVIEPQYESCEAFGKTGAMVQVPRTEAGRGKAGMLGHDGKWLIEPKYDSVGDAGTGTGMIGHRPGFSHIGVLQNMFLATYGTIDLDTGKVVVEPTYAQVGVLAPERFAFSELQSPQKTVKFLGMPNQERTQGMMDAKGKVLIKPEQFIKLSLTADQHHVLAAEGQSTDANRALYDLQGKLLVPAKWQDIKVDEARGVIFGYRVEGQNDNAVRTLRAMYRLDGTVVFDTNRLPCGAEQVVDGKGKVLWPADAQAHCPEPEPVADAS
ncbi:WG repeat-containing protein [Pseudomonas sp. NPDC089401]|uniref:WG repeat-containing protein n=1 Tax=Pseudomonas sp. NPDC089401 TaxID=3364462 RepID=UPI0038215254